MTSSTSRYTQIQARLAEGRRVVLDGGTGTELERRGVSMDSQTWCGTAALDNIEVLEAIHRDYVTAQADVITANTYASSRLMLDLAGLGNQFETVNKAAVRAALRARDHAGRNDVLVAGSLSHRIAIAEGTARPDANRAPTPAALEASLTELAELLRDTGCDLLILEMMYDPDFMAPAFAAAASVGLPVWAGFSVRRGAQGQVLSFSPDADVPFAEIVGVLKSYRVEAAGIMHTSADLVSDALDILRRTFSGPLLAYPDSGYFKSPNWQFEEAMTPDKLYEFAVNWIAEGVQIIGGCCGLSPPHIEALARLKTQSE